MSAFLHQAVLATQKIIGILHNKDDSLYALHNVGAGGDRSIGADLISERIYMEHLLSLASINSEESGFIQGAESDIIVLDPLDGSDNFLSHIPYYGSSLALCDKDGKVKEAVIFNFCTKEGVARLGENTFNFDIESYLLNGIASTQTLQCTTLSKCGIFEKAYCNPHIAAFLYKEHLKFRSLGASALSMAKAYEANFILFVGKIRDFDSKAGLFLCKDLHHISTDNFTLISKDKHIFDTISHIFAKDKGL
ncbi:inositol monophosphatase family protein [Helicobacter japonicus]|uniref:Inositol monophosphatase n=1 Tax=Helicobacter japonicus TaxID=425400 RepID=A0A4U8TQ15_9HELI|nr:inositol monophosphatase family protein [Helicobacter japonicus]TLE02720.1 inositol monophosphatase [Helicobacter japonicus]